MRDVLWSHLYQGNLDYPVRIAKFVDRVGVCPCVGCRNAFNLPVYESATHSCLRLQFVASGLEMLPALSFVLAPSLLPCLPWQSDEERHAIVVIFRIRRGRRLRRIALVTPINNGCSDHNSIILFG